MGLLPYFLDPGVRFDESQMKMVKIIELEESDKSVPEDERTMEELRKIANTIFECVQFTTECPSGQENGKVPVLDLQLYVGEDGLVKHETLHQRFCDLCQVCPQ